MTDQKRIHAIRQQLKAYKNLDESTGQPVNPIYAEIEWLCSEALGMADCIEKINELGREYRSIATGSNVVQFPKQEEQ